MIKRNYYSLKLLKEPYPNNIFEEPFEFRKYFDPITEKDWEEEVIRFRDLFALERLFFEGKMEGYNLRLFSVKSENYVSYVEELIEV